MRKFPVSAFSGFRLLGLPFLQRRLLGGDSGLDLRDHLLQQGLAFFFCLGVDGVDLPLALGVGWGVAALVEVVVEFIDAAGAELADLACVGAEFFFVLPHLLLGGKPVLQGFVVRVGLAAADAALDLLRRLALHGAGDCRWWWRKRCGQ